MTDREVLKCIDEGANFYISLFGKAEHMETVDTPYYSYVRPTGEEYGIRFAYNISIDDLSDEQQKAVIEEIRAQNMPAWVDLLSSDRVFRGFFGREKVHAQTEFGEYDEVYMAMLPDEKPDFPLTALETKRVCSRAEFTAWVDINNGIFAQGNSDIHPVYHYHLSEQGLLKCYIRYYEGKPASIAAVMDNSGVASLEFVATVPELRRKGFAKEVCAKAIQEAFQDGAKILTVRAINAVAARLYRDLGFRSYNHAI